MTKKVDCISFSKVAYNVLQLNDVADFGTLNYLQALNLI
jgi:hypothetical protein